MDSGGGEKLGITGADLLNLLDRIGTRIDAGFARVETKMDGKADKSDIARIDRRLDEHGRSIGALKDRQRSEEAAAEAVSVARSHTIDRRRWVIGTAAVTLAALPTVLAVFHLHL